MRQFTKKAVSGFIALGMLLGGLTAGTTMGAGNWTPRAMAAEPKPAYATARLEKLADGTGHGTPAQSFVNSRNGFTPGDDTPQDGVVSSGDTVEYRANLSFTAARERQVRVEWNLKDAPMLQASSGVDCTSGQLVTARQDGSACVYTVPSGAVETITQSFTLTARDTGGKAVTNQKPLLSVGRVGETSVVDYPAAPITVVSAPAADLVIDNGGDPDNHNGSWERRVNWVDTGMITGYFDLKVKPLTYPGSTTTHGASVTGPWAATLDVSAFPQGTTFTMDGTSLPVKDGRITVPSGTGDRTLNWSIPATQVHDMQPGDVRYYDIQVIPDRTVFQSDTSDTALKNLGTGGEPGTNQGRDQSTRDEHTGARAGYPYANNDWTRAIIQYYRGTPGQTPLFDKTLQRPYTPGKTLFDPESLNFNDSASDQTIVHYLGSDTTGDTVASGAQVRTILTLLAGNVTGVVDATQHPSMTDTWDPTIQQWDGGLQTTQGDRTLTPGEDYTVQWTTGDPTVDATVWQTGVPGDTQRDVKAIRFTFDPTRVQFDTNAASIQVRFLTRVTADTTHGNVKADDTMTGMVKTDRSTGTVTITDFVWAIPPANPAASITNTVRVTGSDGRDRADDQGNPLPAQPGDTAAYVMHPTVRNIQLSGTSMHPTVTIPYPDGLVDVTCTAGQWKMTVTGDGVDRRLVFTLTTADNGITPSLATDGTATLPDITWKGRVSNLASGTVTAAATSSVDVDANGTVPAHPNVTSNTATALFTLSDRASESGVLTADQSQVEINDLVSFSFNLYAKGQGRSGRSDTVIHMPSNQDKTMLGENNTGLDGSWNEYDRGSSKYSGTWTLTDPVTIQGDNSTPTTVQYSTTVAWTDDPKDYEWKTWDQLSDGEKTGVTAVRVMSDFTAGSDGVMPVSAANGRIVLHPSGNTKGDQYNMWPGRSRFSDGHAMGNLPWADRTVVVAGSISGTVWWDRDENATMDDGEERIPNIEVTLWAADQDGNKQGDKPLATTSTSDKGEYKFDLLHSGAYVTVVKRTDGTTTDTGVQTKVTTYYSQDKPVANTYSWNWQLRDHAKDVRGRIPLGVGQNQTRVDFGYAKPDPKATLDKTQTKLDCTDAQCTVNWDVKVTNNGKTTGKLPNGQMIETLSTGNAYSLALDADGNAWAWGQGDDGQLGNGSTSDQSVPVMVSMPGDGVKFTQVSAGYFHSLALDADGNAWAWGWGESGRLGTGSTDNQLKPVMVSMPEGVRFTQVAASYIHSVALDTNGNAWAWGWEDYSVQLKPVMVSMPEGVRFTQVSAGGAYFSESDLDSPYSLALDADGNAWAWGHGSYGQLGTGNTTGNQLMPVKVSMPENGVKFTQVSAGSFHSLALDADGNVWSWGMGESGRLGTGSTDNQLKPVKVSMPENGVKFTQVSAGGAHSVALDADGNAWAWGRGNLGMLGNGSTDDQLDLVMVSMPDGVRFTQVSAGGRHSLALDTNGNAWAWGYGSSGQLGTSTTDIQLEPVKVVMPDGGVKFQQGASVPVDDSGVSAGTSTFPQSSTLSDRMSSIVENVSATVGTTSRTPDQTVKFTQVSASGYHSLALDADGNAWAWGSGESGQLGNGSTDSRSKPAMVSMPSGVRFTQVSAGSVHSLALDTDGNAWSWGDGYFGRLGNGSTDSRSKPAMVSMPSGVRFTQVSAGGDHSVALDANGNAWSWGRGTSGQLGNGSTSNQLEPVMVSMPSGVRFTQVSAGGDHSVALDASGNAWTWGWGTSGQLGNGSTDDQLEPVMVSMPSGVQFTQVTAGNTHSVALDTNGNAWAWGEGGDGRLGNGSASNQLEPAMVSMPSGVRFTQVAAGYDHSVALDTNGNAWAWGEGYNSQLGNGSTDAQLEPAMVSMPSGVRFTQVAAGYDHSVALDTDGDAWAWGYGRDGELGDGKNINQSKPVAVDQTVPGVSVDPTAIPIDPSSTIQSGGDVVRTYSLPYEVQPGGYVVYHFTGTIKRSDKDQVVHNQSWFDSPDTPYSGTPNALEAKVMVPNAPDDTRLDSSSHDVKGNVSCMTGSDYSKPEMEHWFSIGAEDSCDQVGTVIPAYTTEPVLGSISGLYWRDVNGDGVRQDTETDRIKGQQVILEDQAGNQVKTTSTDGNGAYRFTDLPLGSYRVRFSRVDRSDFTLPDVNDQTVQSDGSSTDSDAITGDDYGMGSPTVTLTDADRVKDHVDAGVLVERSWTSAMPFTGGWLLIALLVVGVIGMIGGVILLRPGRRER